MDQLQGLDEEDHDHEGGKGDKYDDQDQEKAGWAGQQPLWDQLKIGKAQDGGAINVEPVFLRTGGKLYKRFRLRRFCRRKGVIVEFILLYIPKPEGVVVKAQGKEGLGRVFQRGAQVLGELVF